MTPPESFPEERFLRWEKDCAAVLAKWVTALGELCQSTLTDVLTPAIRNAALGAARRATGKDLAELLAVLQRLDATLTELLEFKEGEKGPREYEAWARYWTASTPEFVKVREVTREAILARRTELKEHLRCFQAPSGSLLRRGIPGMLGAVPAKFRQETRNPGVGLPSLRWRAKGTSWRGTFQQTRRHSIGWAALRRRFKVIPWRAIFRWRLDLRRILRLEPLSRLVDAHTVFRKVMIHLHGQSPRTGPSCLMDATSQSFRSLLDGNDVLRQADVQMAGHIPGAVFSGLGERFRRRLETEFVTALNRSEQYLELEVMVWPVGPLRLMPSFRGVSVACLSALLVLIWVSPSVSKLENVLLWTAAVAVSMAALNAAAVWFAFVRKATEELGPFITLVIKAAVSHTVERCDEQMAHEILRDLAVELTPRPLQVGVVP